MHCSKRCDIFFTLEVSKLLTFKYNIIIIFRINNCINIENNIKDISIIKESIKKYNNSNEIKIVFSPEEEKITQFVETIRKFGYIGEDKNLSKIANFYENQLIKKWISNDNNISFSLYVS